MTENNNTSYMNAVLELGTKLRNHFGAEDFVRVFKDSDEAYCSLDNLELTTMLMVIFRQLDDVAEAASCNKTIRKIFVEGDNSEMVLTVKQNIEDDKWKAFENAKATILKILHESLPDKGPFAG